LRTLALDRWRYEPKETIMNRIRRFVTVLAGLACAWLGLAVTAPSAFARIIPPPGGPVGPTPAPAVPDVTRTVVVGGMPGWQITLIAAGVAILAAALAVLADRVWTAHRKTTLPAA
jgi:hypothetical protein